MLNVVKNNMATFYRNGRWKEEMIKRNEMYPKETNWAETSPVDNLPTPSLSTSPVYFTVFLIFKDPHTKS